VEPTDTEIMHLEQIKIPQIIEHLDGGINKQLRVGCLYESTLRNRSGDPCLEQI